MTSICIDGFNLALTKGTGIATYGRNLLESEGYHVESLARVAALENGKVRFLD